MLCFIVANVLASIQYFLLNALTGEAIAIINTIRCIIFYYYKKKDKKISVIFLIIFSIVAIVSGAFTWQNNFSILPIVSAIIFTYGLWQEDINVTRICTAFNTGGWMIYDIIVKAYVDVLKLACEKFNKTSIQIKKEMKALKNIDLEMYEKIKEILGFKY